MYDIFESDFIDFINAINLSETEYIIVGCYAVILQGYLRTTQDIDIWVNKSEQNYTKLTKAFALFGMPVFDMTLQNFLGDDFDVFSFGRSPFRIDVITKLKGLEFADAYLKSEVRTNNGFKVRFLQLKDLITAKTAAGRYRDLDDIEKLTKNLE